MTFIQSVNNGTEKGDYSTNKQWMAQEAFIDQSGLALLHQRNCFVCVCAFNSDDVMPKATVPIV